MSSAALRALARAVPEEPEADVVPGAPHPRSVLGGLGHAGPEQAILSALAAGKLHHAWLLSGPEGVGKASFAYRVARYLLAETERGPGLFGETTAETLDVAPESHVAHLVAQGAHPDLAVLNRRYDHKQKRLFTEIAVKDVQDTLRLFERTAAFGGWRIVLVDSTDDLNASSANALLKKLEEPPSKSLFLLISNQPERVLPTIRSRCRRLDFSPLPVADVARVLTALAPEAEGKDEAVARSGGSPGRAFRLLDPGLRKFVTDVEAALAALPSVDPVRIDRIGEGIRASKSGLDLFGELLRALEGDLAQRVRALATGTARPAERLAPAELWAELRREAVEIEAYNLDPRPFAIRAFGALAALASRAAG